MIATICPGVDSSYKGENMTKFLVFAAAVSIGFSAYATRSIREDGTLAKDETAVAEAKEAVRLADQANLIRATFEILETMAGFPVVKITNAAGSCAVATDFANVSTSPEDRQRFEKLYTKLNCARYVSSAKN